MTRYYFHATDGYAAVFDRVGSRLFAGEFEAVAAETADAVRRRFGALADLSEWSVVVCADRGDEVMRLTFAELAHRAQPREAAA